MAPQKQITLYTAPYSPFGHRARLALDDAGVKYTLYEFEKHGKPEWYCKNINPLGRIPAITWGGPEVPPEEPSPESAKIVESLALVEFVAEIFPEAKLLPADPILRAKARAFISVYESYVSLPMRGAFFTGEPVEGVLEAIAKLQGLLPPTGFAVGEWSFADIAVGPFVVRMMLIVRAGIGAYGPGEGKKILNAIDSERFARFRKYVNDIKARPSFQKNWDEARELEIWKNHPGFQRFQKPQAAAES